MDMAAMSDMSNSWAGDHEHMGQGQKLLYFSHLPLVNIYPKYENDLFSGMKGQKSLYMTPLLLVVTHMKMIRPVKVNIM